MSSLKSGNRTRSVICTSLCGLDHFVSLVTVGLGLAAGSTAFSRNGCSGYPGILVCVELGREFGVCERTQVDGRFREVQAGVLVLLLRQRGRVRAPREEAVVFFFFRYFARETTMSTPGHITITRGCNGPSTRVPRVMLTTSLGSHVSSRVCASFAVLGTVGQSLLSTLLKLDVRIQGQLLGCAVVLVLW